MRHLKIYRAIRLINREGSIRKAAEVLALSPSALNRAVQAFEEEMNVPLFERIPSGVRLSVAGELLFDLIDRHLTEFDDLQSQLNNLRDGLAGTLRIHMGSDLNAGLLPAAVAEFEATYPGVSIEIATHDTTEGLQRRTVDLAILTNPITDETVEVIYSQAVALAAWHHGAALSSNAGLWDIVEARLMLPPHGTGSRAAVSHLLRRHRLEEGVTTTLTAAEARRRPEGGSVVCIFPENTSLTGTRLPFPAETVQLTVLRANRVPLTRSAEAFLTILQKRLDALIPRSV